MFVLANRRINVRYKRLETQKKEKDRRAKDRKAKLVVENFTARVT